MREFSKRIPSQQAIMEAANDLARNARTGGAWGQMLNELHTIAPSDQEHLKQDLATFSDRVRKLGFDPVPVLKEAIPRAFGAVGEERFVLGLDAANAIAIDELVVLDEQPKSAKHTRRRQSTLVVGDYPMPATVNNSETNLPIHLHNPAIVFDMLTQDVAKWDPQQFKIYLQIARSLIKAGALNPPETIKTLRDLAHAQLPFNSVLMIADNLAREDFDPNRPFTRLSSNVPVSKAPEYIYSVSRARDWFTPEELSNKIRAHALGEVGMEIFDTTIAERLDQLEGLFPSIDAGQLEQIVRAFTNDYKDTRDFKDIACIVVTAIKGTTDKPVEFLERLKHLQSIVPDLQIVAKKHGLYNNITTLPAVDRVIEEALALSGQGKKPTFVYHPMIMGNNPIWHEDPGHSDPYMQTWAENNYFVESKERISVEPADGE